MGTNINFDKKLGLVNGTSIILPSGPGADFSTKSLSFDGVDEYISTSEVYSELDGQTKATFSLWVKPQLNQYGILFHVPRNTTSAQGQVLCFLDTSYRVRWSMDTTSYYGNSLINVITLNAWNHILICIDLTQSASQDKSRVFINGVNQTAVSNLGTRTQFSTSTGSLLIGEEKLEYLTPFLGNMDEFAIWAGQDLRNDVATIYNNGKPADLTSLNPTSWYRAGENSTFAYPQILMPENTNKDKVSKYSLSFDGNVDYVSLSTISLTSAFSISAWVKFSTLSSAESHIINTGTSNTNRIGVYSSTSFQVKIAGTNVFISETGGNDFVTNQWQHVLVTRDASNNVNVFRNGSPFGGSPTLSGTLTLDSIFRFNTNQYALGYCDEVAVWSDDLSASANAIYNGGVPNDIASLYPTRLEGYWKLGEEAKFTDNWLIPNSALSNFSKYSFNFDGLDDYIDCGQVTQIQNTNALSVSCWFNYKTLSSSVNGIVSKDSTSRIDGNWYISTQNATIRFLLKTANGQDALNSGTISLNSWNHLLCVWNGSTMKIYINGSLNNSISLSNATGTLGLRTTDVLIGRRLVGSINDGFFNGGIDEVAVWNSDQSAAVTAIYNGGKPKDLSGLSPVSWWRMGEEATYDSGTSQFTIPDQAGTNTGTSSNTMLLETLVGDAPQYYGGGISDSMDIFDRVGDAPVFVNNFSLDFDGIDDYVEIGSPTSIQNLTSQITISFWIKAPRVFTTNYYTPLSKGEYAAVGSQWTIQVNTANARNISGGGFTVFPNSNAITDRQTIGFPTPVDDNQWHHMMFVNDGTDLRVYLDGQLEATGLGKGRTLYNGNRSLKLGRLTGSPSVGRLQGNLDEVAIFGTALGLTEAQTIYNNGVPNNLTSLSPVSWWRFEEGSGTTATDSGSGGNDGTLTNGPLYDTDRILTPKANNTVSFNMEEADIVEDTP